MSCCEYKAKLLNFCEIKFGHKNTPTPLTLMSWHNYAILSKALILSTKVEQNPLETYFSIVIWRQMAIENTVSSEF